MSPACKAITTVSSWQSVRFALGTIRSFRTPGGPFHEKKTVLSEIGGRTPLIYTNVPRSDVDMSNVAIAGGVTRVAAAVSLRPAAAASRGADGA